MIKGTTFPYDTIIGLGVTPQDIIDYGEREFINPFTESDKEKILRNPKKGKVCKMECNAFILWLDKYPTDAETFSYLAHEIFHLSDLILRYAGASLSDDSDEVWAYLIDWYTRTIYQKFNLIPEIKGRFKRQSTKPMGQKLGSGARFKAVERKAAASGARNPAAVAAAAGIKKYGQKKMTAMATAGKRRASK